MTWKTITLALVVAATTVALAPTDAAALPANQVWLRYYSDADMTNQVGVELVTSCQGVGNALQGSTSPYWKRTSLPCSGGPAQVKCYVHNVKVPCGHP